MHTPSVVVSVLLLAQHVLQGQAWTSPRWDQSVIVDMLKKELPSEERQILKYLADLMDRPELASFSHVQLNGLTTGRWKEWLPLFEEGLISKARKQSMDAESLQQCLIAVSNRLEALPHLPVAAYSTKQGETAVWIVAFIWEFPKKKEDPSVPLNHIQVFAFDSLKRKILGFATCN